MTVANSCWNYSRAAFRASSSSGPIAGTERVASSSGSKRRLAGCTDAHSFSLLEESNLTGADSPLDYVPPDEFEATYLKC